MLHFLSPIDGDMLNANDGEERDDGRLYIRVRLYSDSGVPTVNGTEAEFTPPYEYAALVPLDGWRNTLTAETDSETAEIAVFRLRDAVGYYQFFIDDNICFLRDIARNAQVYRSIYENPYLGFFRSMYDKYGTLVHMHVYYETCSASPDARGGEDRFDLSMMPDKFKDEWKAAAEWLRLTFHARADKPDWPHQNATYEDTLRDIQLVNREIRRFAGEELLSPATVPHWNEVSVGAMRAFRTAGYRILPGASHSAQYAPRGMKPYVKSRDFWYDRQEDVYHCPSVICLNRTKTADIEKVLDEAKADPARSGFIYMMIHEQYFYPDYKGHLPDFRERVERGIAWAVNNGYKAKWMEDIVLEPKASY